MKNMRRTKVEKMSKNESFKLKKSAKFSVKRTTAVAYRVFGQLRRDRRTFGIIIGMPVLIMIIFGFARSCGLN